ncbi:MAG: ATP synthase F1 subunit epsilon, partial [Lachnospiraceae bacterium]
TMLELTTSEGDIGVYAGHIPMTMVLMPGVATITEPEGKRQAAVHSGFLQILPDKVTVLAEIAEWPEEIDENRAIEAKKRAERRLSQNEPGFNRARAEIALKKSLVRLSLLK